ncbi:hypothetical protein [Maricaulis sp.]|uniref:hypothetical protein n=1 Tax=Maricaulis sp. TaxID=1486257 RepID=UPI0025C4B8F6|nr:hypothetical protein [Maricaulis sp.]
MAPRNNSPTDASAGKPEQPAYFQPAEVRLYAASPMGFAATTALIFALVYGFYLLVATFTQRPPVFETDDQGQLVLTQVAWIGFVLSLIFTAGVAFTESGRQMWARERDALLAAVHADGEASVHGLDSGIQHSWRPRYLSMFIMGALGGLGFNVFMMFSGGFGVWAYINSVGFWFLVTSPLLYGIGFRACVDVARESGAIKQLIRDHIEIDLFHLDRLAVFGRIGLRAARSWMIMAAILLLFLVNPNNPEQIVDARQLWVTVPIVSISVLGGLFLLTSSIHPVHKKICAAKAAELNRIHTEMARQRVAALAGDAEAASALAGLTDYEVWVDARPEWPVSGGVTTRFSLYILLPILPIVGSYLFEKLADQFVTGGVV